MHTVRYTHSIFAIISILSSSITFGMQEPQPLSITEQIIFMHEVKRIGRETIANEITHVNPYTIELKFYLTEINNNRVNQRIFETITIKEKDDGYHPKGKIDFSVGDFIQPNNILGYYTHYWHGEDKEGKFIKCTANFTHKEVLEKMLAQYTKNNSSKL